MTFRRWFPLALLLLLPAQSHCSGTASRSGEQLGGLHLPELSVCGKSNGGGTSTGQAISCAADSDCVAGFTNDTGVSVNGKCVAGTCNFDQCIGDTDCPRHQACVCMHDTRAPSNQCLDAQCRIDADCGPHRECAPSASEGGPSYGIVGRFCRTPSDTCATDAECNDGAVLGEPGVAGTCVYMLEVGHWGCTYARVAG